MSLSSFALCVWVFLISAGYLGWFSVEAKVIGIVGIVFVVLAVLEAAGVLGFSLPLRRREA